MSADMSADFGIVTAYGYALSKGYEGTEEEFAEQQARMAGYAADINEIKSEVSGHAADINAIKSAFDADESELVGSEGKLIYKFAQRVKAFGVGFVDVNGNIVATNPNYKYGVYDIPAGCRYIEVPLIYIAGDSSNYAVIAAYKNDELLGIFSNHDSSEKMTNTRITWKIPRTADKLIVTFGNRKSLSAVLNVWFRGIFSKAKTPMIFNGRPGTGYALQYYFHVPVSSLNGAATFSLNGKFRFPTNIIQYEYFLTTYDSGYTNRTFLYHVTSSAGVNGNEVSLALNAWDITQSIRDTAEYAGFLINFQLAQPPTTTTGQTASSGIEGFRDGGVYPCYCEYCLINDVPVSTNLYPNGNVNCYVAKSADMAWNPMLGGRLCCIGDSLTAVYYKQEEESWPYLIARWNSMSFDNIGESGCPLAFLQSWHDDGHKCMAEKCDELAASKYYTHIFVMGGANDYNRSIAIGQNTDTEYTTFKGAVNYMIDTLTSKFPCAKIVFATTYQRTANRADKPYADAMLEVCRLRGIPCLNNYENSGVQMNSEPWMAKFGANGTTSNMHLNAAGDLFVAPRFEHALKYGIL